MKNWKMSLFALPLAATLVACPTPDPAPTITATTPANNATGVSATAPITVTFSESTTKTGTFTASPTFNADVTFNADGSVMTITPKAALTAATKYTITINNVVDSASNALTGTNNLSFTITAPSAIPSNSTLDGTVVSQNAGTVTPFTSNETIRIGQTDTAGVVDGIAKGYLSFTLPAGVTAAKVKTAILKIAAVPDGTNGSAGLDLGNIVVESMDIGAALDAADFGSAGTQVATITKTTNVANIDLSTAVKNAITAGKTRLDLRLGIPGIPTSGTAKWIRYGAAENSQAVNRPSLTIDLNP